MPGQRTIAIPPKNCAARDGRASGAMNDGKILFSSRSAVLRDEGTPRDNHEQQVVDTARSKPGSRCSGKLRCAQMRKEGEVQRIRLWKGWPNEAEGTDWPAFAPALAESLGDRLTLERHAAIRPDYAKRRSRLAYGGKVAGTACAKGLLCWNVRRWRAKN